MPDLWQATERARDAHERRLTPRIEDALSAIGAEAAAAVREAGSPQAALLAAGRVGQASEDASRRMLETIYRQVAPAFGNAAFEGVQGAGKALKRDPEPPNWEEMVRRFILTEGAVMVQEITETTREDIRQVLTEGIEEGEGVEAMAKRLEEAWGDVSRVRARRIVRTETIAASNWGSLEGAKATGLDLKKEWIATPGDPRTRDSHEDADEQTVAMSEDFDIDGEAAAFPGDPRLSAHERINCRCSMGFVPVDDGTKSFIEERNARIKAAYPDLRDQMGKWAAMGELAEEHGLSEHTVRDIVYERGHYG